MSENKEEYEEIISLLRQIVSGQEKICNNINDMVNLFKKYEIEEVINSEDLRNA